MLLLLTSMSLYYKYMHVSMRVCIYVHIHNTCHIMITALSLSLRCSSKPLPHVTAHPLYCLERHPIFCGENHVVSEYRTAPIPILSQDSSSAFKGNISIYIKINHQKSISGTILRLPKKLRLLTKNTSHMNQVSSELHHTPI